MNVNQDTSHMSNCDLQYNYLGVIFKKIIHSILIILY